LHNNRSPFIFVKTNMDKKLDKWLFIRNLHKIYYYIIDKTMYSYTRNEAAEILAISTRSLDRYVKAGKLRSKKKGKIVYIKTEDVDKMAWKHKTKQQVIINSGSTKSKENIKTVVAGGEANNWWTLSAIYADLRREIKQKDELIQNLSVRVGRAEEIAKNSVNLVEFKKSQFLLEESKGHLSKEVWELAKENSELKSNLKYEKTTNIVLILFVIILIIVSAAIWYTGI